MRAVHSVRRIGPSWGGWPVYDRSAAATTGETAVWFEHHRRICPECEEELLTLQRALDVG